MTETFDTPLSEEAPPRRLVRVDEGRWLGGVAAGLGRYFDVNPLVYRIAFAALAFAGGIGILLYVAAWLVIPVEGRDDSVAVGVLREHRDRPWLVLGVGLLLFFALLALAETTLWHGIGNVWVAALLAGAALVWWQVAHRSDAPAADSSLPQPAAPSAARPPRKPSLLAPVLGVLLAAAGVMGLLAALGIATVDVEIGLAAALAVVGVAIAAGAFTGFRVGGLVVLGVLLLTAFVAATATPVSLSSGIGDKVERPFAAAAIEREYEYGIGEYDLDLSGVELPAGETEVEISLGIGDLTVIVPADAALEIDAHAGAGEVVVLGSRDDGIGADRELSVAGAEPDSPTLVLDASVGVGHLTVARG